MTSEEVIRILKEIEIPMNGDNERERTEVLEMAIAALSAEHCEDCISRQGVINAVANTCFWLSANDWNEFIDVIQSLPSVQPINKWIPVSERLPEDYDRVLITVNGCRGLIVREARYCKAQNEFEVLHNHERWEVGEKGLLAWMPLPSPWKGE